MKSFRSPSSSSSTSQTHPNYATNGCLSSILCRFLGFHTLPTLPFDHHIKDSFQNNEFNELKGNPGIVAKLMGLDSMPLELRKKSNSVLEAPTFVELENDKFIILSFEGGGKDKELRLSSSKTRNGLTELKDKTKKKKNQETPICQIPKNSYELFNLKSKFDSKKLCDIESDSEKSSPVSVLEFPDHQEASHSGKEDLKSKNSKLRRKLRGDLDKNAASASSSSTSSYNLTDTNGKECVGLNKNNEMWEEVSKMAERDMIERWKGEDIEEIGVSFGLQILDQLILEFFTIT